MADALSAKTLGNTGLRGPFVILTHVSTHERQWSLFLCP